MPRGHSESLLRAIDSLFVLLPQWRREDNTMTTFLPAGKIKEKIGVSDRWALSSFSLQVSTPLPLDFAGPPPKIPYLINVTLSHITDFGPQYMSGSDRVEVSSSRLPP